MALWLEEHECSPQMHTSRPACGRARCTVLPWGLEGKYWTTQTPLHHLQLHPHGNTGCLQGNHSSHLPSVSAKQTRVHNTGKSLSLLKNQTTPKTPQKPRISLRRPVGSFRPSHCVPIATVGDRPLQMIPVQLTIIM